VARLVIPTFVIFLREGIEAAMIIAILLAYLDRIGQRRHFRDVFAGVVAALVLVTGGGVAAYVLIHRYDGSRAQLIFETATYILAAVVLTYMTFWMQRHARSITGELERRSDDALSGGARFGLGLLAFQAVGREGLETMVFTLAIVFASSSQRAASGGSRWLLLGAILGLAVALGIAWWIYKLGHRLNVGRFFRVLGVVLMVFAAGLLADAVENLQALGWLPSGHALWSSTGIVSESSSLGDVFHSLLGYADRPTALQVAVWVAYLAISLTAFVHLARKSKRSRDPKGAVVAAVQISEVGPAPGPSSSRA
jgi:high-affinity iron transporter